MTGGINIGSALLILAAWLALSTALYLLFGLKSGDQAKRHRADALKFRDYHFTPLSEGRRRKHG